MSSFSWNGVTIGGKIPLKSRDKLFSDEVEKADILWNFLHEIAFEEKVLFSTISLQLQGRFLEIKVVKRENNLLYDRGIRTAAIMQIR